MSDRKEELNDPQVAMMAALEGLQARMWTAMPGIVTAVDLAAQTCTVQPAIQGVTFDRENNPLPQNLPLLLDVPIVWPRAGGFAVTLPLAAGDEVLVVFSSRAIDSWWQNSGIGVPVEARMHDLSDAFAIPGPTSQPRKLANVQADGIEMRTEDRGTYIKLMEGQILIKGNIIHEGNLERTGDTTQTGLLTQNGAAALNGNTAVTGDLTNNGKNIGSTHTHAGSPTAPTGPISNTGQPT